MQVPEVVFPIIMVAAIAFIIWTAYAEARKSQGTREHPPPDGFSQEGDQSSKPDETSPSFADIPPPNDVAEEVIRRAPREISSSYDSSIIVRHWAGMKWYVRALMKMWEPRGRARPAEFWWFVLFSAIGAVLLGGGELGSGRYFLSFVFWPVTVVAGMTVTARRLHDTGRSGAWAFLNFVPPANVVLLVFCARRGDPDSNEHGPSPLATADAPREDATAVSERPRRDNSDASPRKRPLALVLLSFVFGAAILGWVGILGMVVLLGPLGAFALMFTLQAAADSGDLDKLVGLGVLLLVPLASLIFCLPKMHWTWKAYPESRRWQYYSLFGLLVGVLPSAFVLYFLIR